MINRILEDREKRYDRIICLLNEYKSPVLCGKINYPGENKNEEAVQKAFDILTDTINKKFGEYYLHFEILNGYDGPSIVAPIRLDAENAKEMAISLEDESAMGRIFDIDIYLESGVSLGRNELKHSPRKCVVCGKDARICSRQGRHSLDEVKRKINNIINYGEEDE